MKSYDFTLLPNITPFTYAGTDFMITVLADAETPILQLSLPL